MIIGYRAFQLDAAIKYPRLKSTAAPYTWKPGENKAAHHPGCRHAVDPASPGNSVAQGRGSQCGFWAYDTPTKAREHSRKRGDWVTVGAVLGWGNYVLGTEGWRCQYARILALSHAMWDEMDALSTYYNVPLSTFKGLAEFASHFGVTMQELDTKYDTPMEDLPYDNSLWSQYAQPRFSLNANLGPYTHTFSMNPQTKRACCDQAKMVVGQRQDYSYSELDFQAKYMASPVAVTTTNYSCTVCGYEWTVRR